MSTSRAFRAAEAYLDAAHADVELDPHVQHLLGGAYSIHGRQRYRGLSLFPHSIVLEVEAGGGVTAGGDLLIAVEELDVVPDLGPEAAVQAAFRHVRGGSGEWCHTPHEARFSGTRYRPRIVSAFPMASRPTVFSAGPFDEPPQANLVIFNGAECASLAWLVTLVLKNVADFTIVVAASGKEGGTVLYCAAEAASACVARVFPFDAGQPAADIVFPRPLADYPPGLRVPSDFRDWVAADQLDGNNVLMRIGTKNCVISSVVQGSLRRFTPASGSLQEQALNAFFVCNFMHDFFSRIGFGEEDGNFQQENFSGEGKAGDRLVVSIFTSAQGSANMRAQNDGGIAELALGVWQNDDESLGKPTALDTGVVIHEFTHGVSQRLVSGRLNKAALAEPQPLALGEGWSDYFAVTILNYYRPNARRYTFAEFASQRAGGVRPHPYDNFQADVRSLGAQPFDEQHGAGSIFAAALIKMHDDLRVHFNDEAASAVGQETAWRLVVDSMKRLDANPTFIDARDALLKSNAKFALPQAPAIEEIIRRAFAAFGMGRNASCKNTSLKGFKNVDFNA